MKAGTRTGFNVLRYTRLGRVLSWRYPSHRVAFIGSAVAGGTGFVLDGIGDGDWDVLGALLVGLAVFLAWACAREFDPDRNSTAVVALVLAAPLAIWGRPALLLVVVALQGLRLMVGTVGGTLQLADYAAVLLGAAVAGSRPEGWAILLLLAAAVLIAHPRLAPLLAIGVLVSGLASAVAFDASLPDEIGGDGLRIWQLVTLVSIVLALRIDGVQSKTDIGREPLSLTRVRAARLFGGLAVAGALLASASAIPTVLGPVLAALVATAIGAVVPSRRLGSA